MKKKTIKATTTPRGEKIDECILCGCWYCRHFAQYHTMRHSLKVPFIRLWYWFPRFLWKKIYKGTEGKNRVFKTWHGFYIWPLPSESEAINWKWWRIVKFNYKFIFTK